MLAGIYRPVTLGLNSVIQRITDHTQPTTEDVIVYFFCPVTWIKTREVPNIVGGGIVLAPFPYIACKSMPPFGVAPKGNA